MKIDRYRMRTQAWLRAALVVTAAIIGAATVPDAIAATIQLHQDAATAVVARRLFTDNGRRVLTGDPASCTVAYLERPAVAFRDGRLFLRVHLAGRAGLRVNGSCVGAGDSFYTTVSGQPYVAGETIALRDMRLDEGKPEYRRLVESLMQQQVRALLGLNLRDELNKLAQSNATDFRMTLTQFKLIDIAARDALLTVRFDFELQALKP